ncbi:MAG: YraN family protein [Sedimenticola sp.]|mgnify:CR=1 FL=1|nr:MAG: YraN family protein [Sedimenticola sp.]
MFFKKTGKESGDSAEHRARHYLENQGLVTIECNYHSRYGEIDLIMRGRQHLVFIEVRFRTRRDFGSAADSVTPRKQNRIILTASRFLQTRFRNNPPPCRFDVISISGGQQQNIEWIKDAFQPTL